MRNSLVIVGGGFSGTVLASMLLRRPPQQPTDVVLIERSGLPGRGVAYAARDFPYLLNVPAGRLSVDSRDPLQFVRFARERLAQVEGNDFLPRSLYGDYLQETLAQAERNAPSHVRLLRVRAEATAITRTGGPQALQAQFADRGPIAANRIVLALGTPAAEVPAWASAVQGHAAYRQDTWDLPRHLTEQHSVLIVGNGLTMADAASAMSRDARHSPMLHTLSRRGLLPRTQAAFHADAVRGSGEFLLERAHSVRELLAASRALAHQVQMLGGDWREAITFIRNLAPRLWQLLPDAEKRRFLRHVQVHWDVHRHRLPPQLSEHLGELRRNGKLSVNAGRICGIAAAGGRLRVTWQPRGSHTRLILEADLVVNATGPNYSVERTADPLFGALRETGLISEDPLHLGMRTARCGACVDARGRVSDSLFYLGPLLRAAHLDVTAAAELRDEAEQLAAHLASL